MKAKKKAPAPLIVTRGDMALTANKIVAINDRLNAIRIEIKDRVDAIEKEYESEKLDLQAELDALMDASLDWATRNEDVEFKDKKHIKFPRSVVKFHVGKFEVETVGKLKIPEVIELLRNFRMDLLDKTKFIGADYIRQKPELNKELMIQDRERISADQWRKVGVRIVRGKSLTVEGNGEDLENAQSIKEAA